MPIPRIQTLPRLLALTFFSPESVSNIRSMWGKLAEVWHRTLRRLEDRIRYLCWKSINGTR